MSFSNAPGPSRWPTTPETLTDDWCIKRRQRWLRMKRNGWNLLIRAKIAELKMTRDELVKLTGATKHIITEVVRGARDCGDIEDALEKALQIEPGRLHALRQSDLNHAVRSYDQMMDHLEDDLAERAAEGTLEKARGVDFVWSVLFSLEGYADPIAVFAESEDQAIDWLAQEYLGVLNAYTNGAVTNPAFVAKLNEVMEQIDNLQFRIYRGRTDVVIDLMWPSGVIVAPAIFTITPVESNPQFSGIDADEIFNEDFKRTPFVEARGPRPPR